LGRRRKDKGRRKNAVTMSQLKEKKKKKNAMAIG
jgi:hypothetical protein